MESPSSFEAIDADGSAHSVRYHRVREVYRDVELIWQRPRTTCRAPPLKNARDAPGVSSAAASLRPLDPLAERT